MRRFSAVFAVFAGVACASEPKLTPVVGPDGSQMFHVSCAGHEGRCYALAGERCPQGYDIGRTPGERGNFLVRCRQPGYSASAPSWAPTLELAPTPYGTSSPPVSVVPATTAPPGYPPLGPARAPEGAPKNDVGY